MKRCLLWLGLGACLSNGNTLLGARSVLLGRAIGPSHFRRCMTPVLAGTLLGLGAGLVVAASAGADHWNGRRQRVGDVRGAACGARGRGDRRLLPPGAPNCAKSFADRAPRSDRLTRISVQRCERVNVLLLPPFNGRIELLDAPMTMHAGREPPSLHARAEVP